MRLVNHIRRTAVTLGFLFVDWVEGVLFGDANCLRKAVRLRSLDTPVPGIQHSTYYFAYEVKLVLKRP